MLRILILLTFVVLIVSCVPISSTELPTLDGAPPDQSVTPTPPALHGELTILMTGSLADAMQDLKTSFQQENPAVSFVFDVSNPQRLDQLLAQEFQADLLISNDLSQLETAISSGKIEEKDVTAMAGNQLVIITPVQNPGKVTGTNDLTRPGLKVILADPETLEGAYTLAFLEKASSQPDVRADFKEKVIENVISYEENLDMVMKKVIQGEAEAGIVYLSDALKAGPTQLFLVQIPINMNIPITYYMVKIKGSAEGELAHRFQEFVLSERGQTILSQRGFIPVQ